ncbi:MAG TPA: hypothetical protein VMD79_01795 [Solirubrobacteraceae bacterium]|nr:hypothetical protein [Solirubrobacteraceae bacterium]
MPDSESNPRATPADTPPASAAPPARPPDELVLAALERAARHQARETPAVPAWTLLEHLAIPRRSAAARHVSARLAAMQASGWVQRSRRHGAPTWELTAAGERQLRRARDSGALAALPESPQHRTWRIAHTAAEQEIERFRADLRRRLERAAQLLDARERPHSDSWLELGEELQHACRRLASASYCLHEWAEPDDARADIDEHIEPGDEALDAPQRAQRRARRAGRRNVRLWDERR